MQGPKHVSSAGPKKLGYRGTSITSKTVVGYPAKAYWPEAVM